MKINKLSIFKKKIMEKYGVFRNMRNLIFLCGCLMDFNLNKSMS